jgi:uncharacterized protein (DUF2237 family)
MTGFLRNGYCDVPASDSGNHSHAAQVNDKFLDFTTSLGNDLRSVGLTDGCKWCLCVSRWKEAFMAREEGKLGEDAVPKLVDWSGVQRLEAEADDKRRVSLSAIHEKALEGVRLDELRKYAMDKED